MEEREGGHEACLPSGLDPGTGVPRTLPQTQGLLSMTLDWLTFCPAVTGVAIQEPHYCWQEAKACVPGSGLTTEGHDREGPREGRQAGAHHHAQN